MRVDGPLGKDALLLRRFTGREAMSVPFSFSLELLATKPIAAEDLLEKPLTITVDLQKDGKERFIHGLVRTWTSLGREDEFFAYRADISPWLWFLSLYRDCRIFQQMTLVEIIEKVFDDRGYSDFRMDLKGSFPTREFTVQYRESDLDFLSRLMEEEGVFYFFEHSKDAHRLVLADHQGALETSPLQADIPFVEAANRAVTEGIVDGISLESAIYTGASTLDDYHFETPKANLAATVAGNGVGEHYDYPGGYRESGDGTRLSEIRLEAEEARAATLKGNGNSLGVVPGFRFNLIDSQEHDGEYLVLEVTHQSGKQEYRTSESGGFDYRNAFMAIPYATPYRPPRTTPRPTVQGAQTAVVVGPSKEEIYADKYGRIKVRFHWDRESPDDGESSCWIRVASTWAGNKWGAIQIPRVGQEVVVEFLEGNPDRPLVTGGVYNAQMMPPFGASPTQSGLITRSSKEGSTDLANELRFEDKKGEEEVFLHAEKDLTVEVENDSKLTVDNDRWITVEHDRILKVGNDDTVEVSNDQQVDVKNDQRIGVAGNRTLEVAVDYDVSVSSNYSNDVSNDYKLSANSIELKVGGNTIKMDQSGITITGTKVSIEGKTMGELKATMVKIEGKAMAELKAAMTQVKGDSLLMAKGGITLVG